MRKILAFLTLIAVIFTGCFTSTTNSGVVGADRRQLLLISAETMNQSAAQAYVKALSTAKSKGALNIDPILTKRVRAIAARLIAQTPVFREDALKWAWQTNVINEATLNAWCMPGGKIVVYSGLINKLALNDAQIAAVMGHEIAHALREHSREQASHDQVKNIGIFAISEVVGLGSSGANLLNLATQYTISLPFSRSHETEADHIGTELMARAGYDPNEAIKVWEKMSKFSSSAPIEILSTHPSNTSRIADLKVIAKKVEPLYIAAINNTKTLK
ncbi:M48 family metallopeptidase [Campylobacter sp. faydin G-140]|uniref:M48 family metallopeptidase n=1 Tax=Campylobacter anatolicus TaxID=2829105 RepID=UPI001BA359A5|nr:M48 family metallopeptidase [Campylobacter anatolicus]MBR8466451.1 M48 family metallopeptidase [Campylobacter anatolicus]